MHDLRRMISQDADVAEHLLFEGPATLASGRALRDCRLRATFRWLPTPDIHLAADQLGEPRPVKDEASLSVPSVLVGEGTVPVHPFGLDGLGKCLAGFTDTVAGCVGFGRGEGLSSIEFVVPNLLRYAQKHSSGDEASVILVWRDREWVVTLKPCVEETVGKRLYQDRGYAFSHLGQLRRTDGRLFGVGDADDVLAALQLTLWLIRGVATGPTFLVGLDASGVAKWWQWASWVLDRAQGVLSWADDQMAADFPAVFRGISAAMADACQRRILSDVIRLYISGNRGDYLETRMVCVQQALELLAWHRLVVAGQVSKTKYRNSSAGENIAHLLRDLNIPNDLPSGWAAPLSRLGSSAAEAIATVRNDIIHPVERKLCRDDDYDGTLLAAWRLAAWALELSILRTLGYMGSYADRRIDGRWRGQVDPVPWVTSQPG